LAKGRMLCVNLYSNRRPLSSSRSVVAGCSSTAWFATVPRTVWYGLEQIFLRG
jgi:hypothetical protein